jgi:hypothetical protein
MNDLTWCSFKIESIEEFRVDRIRGRANLEIVQLSPQVGFYSIINFTAGWPVQTLNGSWKMSVDGSLHASAVIRALRKKKHSSAQNIRVI